MLCQFLFVAAITVASYKYMQWRSEGGQGGASAPGRRPEEGAEIMPKNFFKFIY